MRQLGLFDTEPVAPATLDLDWRREAELARCLPSGVHFGTSSWTFPGWSGIVYPSGTSERMLRERGLELYVRYPLFHTVGIDRSYYAPMDRATLRRYASQLPAGFRCLQKVPAALTSVEDPRTGEPNPRFLDGDWYRAKVLEPNLESFAPHLGALVLEFAPMRLGTARSPAWFYERLDRFLDSVEREVADSPQLAVELRNRELLTPAYARVLAKHRVAHVFNYWEAMPTIAEQLSLPGLLDTAPPILCRLLIPPGQRYAARKRALDPFDALVDPQPRMRADVVKLAIAAVTAGRAIFVVVNNKAEGCAPLSVVALAESMAAGLPRESE